MAEKKKETEKKEQASKAKKTTASSKKKATASSKKKATASSKKKTTNKDNKLAEELAEYKDKYLRLSAEFDNYRRRTLKEKADLSKTAGEDIIINMLPVLDDFERALQTMSQSEDVTSITQGVELIYNKFKDIMSRKGLKEIEAKEKDFNMDIHEAITKIPAPEESMKGKVVDVIEKGYYLHEKVIRYPKVVVGE